MSETQDLDQTFDDPPRAALRHRPRSSPPPAERLGQRRRQRTGLTLPDVVRTVLTGYADRPALGARAVEFVTDETGRTVAELQPRFETITHGQLVGARAHPRRRVAR